MSLVKLSQPTQLQVIHGAERAVAVFVVATVGYLKLSTGSFTKDTLHAALLAGLTAVYQLVLSTVTTL